MSETITFRPTAQDRALIQKLAAKLGLKVSQVFKLAIRRLAEMEKVKVPAKDGGEKTKGNA